MKILFLSFFFVFTMIAKAQTFKQNQMTFDRVKDAFDIKWPDLEILIKSKGFDPQRFRIFIRVFKEEMKTEIWIGSSKKESLSLLKTYEVAKSSGILGPKIAEGDLQVPEGYYHIDRFNPLSNFHLSLGLNYPNSADKILGADKPGGDIFIHGSDVTVGCVPLTDDKMKEVYSLAVQAKNSGQKEIPVHVFPFHMTNKRLEIEKNNLNYDFWKNMQAGYLYFEEKRKLPKVTTNQSGSYVFNSK
jgi:murein L,D-transpeptidase YafK